MDSTDYEATVGGTSPAPVAALLGRNLRSQGRPSAVAFVPPYHAGSPTSLQSHYAMGPGIVSARAPEVSSVASGPSVRRSLRVANRSSPAVHAASRSSPSVAARSHSRASIPSSAARSQESSQRPSRSRKRDISEVSTSSVPAHARKAPPPKPAPKKRAANLKRPPANLKSCQEEEAKPEEEATCCICMCEPDPKDLALIDGCEHRFCFECVEKWADRENTCPLCKTRFTKIERVNKPKRKRGDRGLKSSKKVKQRDQRSDLVTSPALEAIFSSIAASSRAHSQIPGGLARLIFANPAGGSVVEIGGSDPAAFMAAARRNPHPVPTVSMRAATRSMAAAAFASDDDDDDDDTPFVGFPNFFRSMQARGPPFGGMEGIHLMGAIQMLPFPPTLARSYASNANDRSAGRGAENPLEIEDSDDDDEVEVLRMA